VLAGDLMFMSAGFLSIGLHKIALIKAVLSCNVDLIVSDVDTGKFAFFPHCQLKHAHFASKFGNCVSVRLRHLCLRSVRNLMLLTHVCAMRMFNEYCTNTVLTGILIAHCGMQYG